MKGILKRCAVTMIALGIVWACPFDQSLREYLSGYFWLPFTKQPSHFEKPNVRRISAPFAGMAAAQSGGPLAKMRAAYQDPFDAAAIRREIAAARAVLSLTRREREEVELLDAKVDLRDATDSETGLIQDAKKKLQVFLRTARTPEFLSEARGWLGRDHYLLGERTAAGKIYLDELNRSGSNLSRETLLTSLRMTYDHDGGSELLANLEAYFDTPEHAAFAVQFVTNPQRSWQDRFEPTDRNPQSSARITALLEKHKSLLSTYGGANTFAMLAMRTAIRMGDPAAAGKIAEAVPPGAPVRAEPDFQWMLGSALFLSRQYAAAEQPLLALFRSARSSSNQKAAAAYALCGVYRKTGNVAEQLRYAMWLRNGTEWSLGYVGAGGELDDLSVYWAQSGFDLNLLLESEAPIEALEAFIRQNPNLPNLRLVKYSLAVRLTREHRYEEAARLYQDIYAPRRAPRLRRLAALHAEANRQDRDGAQRLEARFRLAEFISAHSVQIYFNDALWGGYQQYALTASTDYRLTRAERDALIAAERKLKDDQEEYWQAYLILREIVREAGPSPLGRKAAALAVQCLRRIATERFKREDEVRRADTELSNWLRRGGRI